MLLRKDRIRKMKKEEAEEWCIQWENEDSEDFYEKELCLAVKHPDLGDEWRKRAARKLYKKYEENGKYGHMDIIARVHLPEEQDYAYEKWISWLEEVAPDYAKAEIEGYP